MRRLKGDLYDHQGEEWRGVVDKIPVGDAIDVLREILHAWNERKPGVYRMSVQKIRNQVSVRDIYVLARTNPRFTEYGIVLCVDEDDSSPLD